MGVEMERATGNSLPRCGSCKWYERQQQGVVIHTEPQGYCFACPPQCTNLPVNGGEGTASLTNRPTVKAKDRACSMYDPAFKVVVPDSEIANGRSAQGG